MTQQYRKGGFGYGHAKNKLLDLILEKFQEPRNKFQELIKEPEIIEMELSRGANQARDVASSVLKKVKLNLGLMRA